VKWQSLVVGLATVLLKLLGGTLRWTFEDQAGYCSRAPGSPFIVGVWHNRILVLPLVFEWFCRRCHPVSILTSPSRDGALLSAFMANFGMSAVRGSSSRGGVKALLLLRAQLREGVDIAITPDGPRGPVYEPSAGLLRLAVKTGLPVMAIRVDYERYWEIQSWDKFRIPKPFSRVYVTMLAPVTFAVEDTLKLCELLGAQPPEPGLSPEKGEADRPA
jgi:lysophospholipid acyltransferase (LPLAT)-like uncharacterized protein